MFRIRLNTGSEHEVGPGDVFGLIAGAASLPREAIGAIRVQPRHTFVEVREEHAEHVGSIATVSRGGARNGVPGESLPIRAPGHPRA